MERLAELNAMLNMDEKGEKIFWQMRESGKPGSKHAGGTTGQNC